MNSFYRQCRLRKGDTYQVTWIPEEFARVRHPVKLRKREGGGCVRSYSGWDDGWVVVSVGARASENLVRMMERDHTRTRRASDI